MLEELGVPYTLRSVNPRQGETSTTEFMQLNPHGKIPCLQDGDVVLTESAAINSYLGDKYNRLIPVPKTRARALYDQWCFFIMSELDAQSLYIHRKHVMLAAIYGEAPQAVSAAQAYFTKHLRVASETIEASQQLGDRFLMGCDFTAVDILFAHVLDWARQIGWMSESDFPALHSYLDHVMDRPACRRTVELAARAAKL